VSDSGLLERFLARASADESDAAFAALVERHGPMVLGICRQALPCLHDAHDAFQATFLVLVRRARSIQGRGSIAGWLFGIARRVAARARVEAARRQRHLEKLQHQFLGLRASTSCQLPGETDVDYGPLFEEIDALPERFRSPVVLHYFEGLSTSAIALHLGCAPGTVLSRLARARGRLRARLQRRGVSLADALPTVGGFFRSLHAPIVPSSLFQITVRSGSCAAMAGAAVETPVSAAVAALVRRGLRSAILSQAGMASLVFLLVSAGASVAVVMGAVVLGAPRHRASGDSTFAPRLPQTLAAPTKTPSLLEAAATIVIRGRVVGSDGAPVKDAQIVISRPRRRPSEIRSSAALAKTGADGRFEAAVARTRLEQLEQIAIGQIEPTTGPVIGAIAPGRAIAWTKADVQTALAGELTLTLGSDDVPIEGTITGLDGRAIKGLTVRVVSVVGVKSGFLDLLTVDEGRMSRNLEHELKGGIPLGERGPIPAATTDSHGRFRLSGVGRDRLAMLFIEGDSIERSEALVFTDPGYPPPPRVAGGSGEFPVMGPRFAMSVAPGRAVRGLVRDAETRQPITGATVVLFGIGLTAASDAQGHFQITGQPRSRPGWPNLLSAEVDGQPYVKAVVALDSPKRLETVHAEIALKRGAWVEGRIVDRATGKPVQATVEYCPFADNPHLREYVGASFLDHVGGDEPEFPTDEQGRFRAVALAGRGVLGLRTADPSYAPAAALVPEQSAKLSSSFRRPGRYQAIVPIEVHGHETLVVSDIKVARGRPPQGVILEKD
jgi:RNA polymerase sigma factor (sigma-70 family)